MFECVSVFFVSGATAEELAEQERQQAERRLREETMEREQRQRQEQEELHEMKRRQEEWVGDHFNYMHLKVCTVAFMDLQK